MGCCEGAGTTADDTLDLKSTWILKEALRDLYDSTSRAQAERELADWHRWAAVYDVEETNRLAGTLTQWQQRSSPTSTLWVPETVSWLVRRHFGTR